MAKVFRCPTDDQPLQPGMEYTLQLRDSAITVQYAECPACRVILAFTGGRKPRAVASFAVDRTGRVSTRGVRLGSADELAAAERGVRTIAHAVAEHPDVVSPPPPARKRGRRGSPDAEPGAAADPAS